jgi:hypothetical protein
MEIMCPRSVGPETASRTLESGHRASERLGTYFLELLLVRANYQWSSVGSSMTNQVPIVIFFMMVNVAPRLSGADALVFAGLSRRTTTDDARKLYPHSSIVDHHVYVADSDSHDGIGGIDIPGEGPDRRLRVLFEQRTAHGNVYPLCESALNRLRERYGTPSIVQEFDEERARTRRFIWSLGDEAMSLVCFRTGRKPFSAAELTIALRDTIVR